MPQNLGRSARPELGSYLVGRYRLESQIGAGGMGVVYRAIDTQLGRPVAVKLLNSRSQSDGAIARLRLLREARAAAALSSQFCVTVHDVHEALGAPQDRFDFIVMEFVPGQDLQEIIDGTEGGLDPSEVRKIVSEVLTGLSSAHSIGIVHRDIKPANVILSSTGSVKISDFGIARSADGLDRLTTDGFIGSPAFMAPEAFDELSGSVLAAVDVYAVGVLTYVLITGTSPFSFMPSLAALLRAKNDGSLPSPSEVLVGLDPGIDWFVKILTDPDVTRRPRNASEALQQMHAIWDEGAGSNRTPDNHPVKQFVATPAVKAQSKRVEIAPGRIDKTRFSENTSDFLVPVEMDAEMLAQLGWKGEAGLKITVKDGYETSRGDMMREYLFTLAATLEFDADRWEVRYSRGRTNSYPPGLLFVLECAELGEPLIMELLSGDIQKLKRPLRSSESGTLAFSTRRVLPRNFRAKISAFDGLEAAFQRYSLAQPVRELAVEVVDEFDADTVTAHFETTRAFATKYHVILIASGTFDPAADHVLAAAAELIPWYALDHERVELPMPDIATEFIDELGFSMQNLHALFGLRYYYDAQAPRPNRECRWFLHWRYSLSNLPSAPSKVVLRLSEHD